MIISFYCTLRLYVNKIGLQPVKRPGTGSPILRGGCKVLGCQTGTPEAEGTLLHYH